MSFVDAGPIDDPDAVGSRKLILFADGTGNAFSRQESNVWRLYSALDRTRPNHKALYIEGVGTSGNAVIAKIDGATGFGVPSNVRKLYNFLCWNWKPGDEIYLFGFSRGAFTIRTLAALVAKQGLMPAEIDGRPATAAELKRNAMGAWRAYRSETAPFRWRNISEDIWTLSPVVAIIRAVRDIAVFGWRRLWRNPTHEEVLEQTRRDTPERAREQVPIKFMGLFDTVEAYGLPIEEFRSVVNWAIWPISFRNRRCNPIVKTIRHALSLDDERTTFHPIRFDQSQDTAVANAADPRTREVWFAGMHSDVGGGYDDDSLALVPFQWMAEEAEAAGLNFDPAAIDRLKRRASPLAPIHDSRKGLASLYRYDPRHIDSDPLVDGGSPIIHHGVAQKLVFGTGGYAPINLPHEIRVLKQDGSIDTIIGNNQMPTVSTASSLALAPDEEAVQFMRAHPPRKELLERLKIFVVWRRLAYALLITSTAVIALMPVLGAFFEELFNPLKQVGMAANVDAGVEGVVDLVDTIGGSFLPAFLTPWINALRSYTTAMMIFIALWAISYALSGGLQDKIRDYAYEAWISHKGSSSPMRRPAALFLWLGEQLVTPVWKLAHRVISRWLAPALFSLVLLFVCAVGLSRSAFDFMNRTGAVCTPKLPDGREKAQPVLGAGDQVKLGDFSPAELCTDLDVTVLKGQTYTLWIEPTETFIDRTIVAEPAGFTSNSKLMFLFGKTFRRVTEADWFQPMAQIGTRADAVFPLFPADGHRPVEAGSWPPSQNMEAWPYPDVLKQPQFMQHLDDVVQKQKADGHDTFVTRFIAPRDGPLYLYVNDMIVALPFAGGIDAFYRNNRGKANITILRDPLPVKPNGG